MDEKGTHMPHRSIHLWERTKVNKRFTKGVQLSYKVVFLTEKGKG